MSMMFGGSRDYIDTINGVKYYEDWEGNIFSDDGFSMDLVNKEELESNVKRRINEYKE